MWLWLLDWTVHSGQSALKGWEAKDGSLCLPASFLLWREELGGTWACGHVLRMQGDGGLKKEPQFCPADGDTGRGRKSHTWEGYGQLLKLVPLPAREV